VVQRRLWAAASLLLVVATGLALALAVARFPRGITFLACVCLAAVLGWTQSGDGGPRGPFAWVSGV
jgi:hypothetical protein